MKARGHPASEPPAIAVHNGMTFLAGTAVIHSQFAMDCYTDALFIMPLSNGTRLGPYEILALLGAGGMGEVYRAHDGRLHRDVAIKILNESTVAQAERQARFQRESRAVAALNHPNIV